MHSSLQLVDYSSTDDEDDDDVDKSEVSTRNKSDFIITRTNLPPLPESFRDIYIVNPRIGDDPALHSGRVRTQPHVKGLWPSHVYLEGRIPHSNR
ncbi:U6 snRNA phosphodiesterase [Neolecta irregularis DAH-3]|uniref:U6 snRNA phosphodiesterase 1 n=1 Tax=Neolecta irregularis (strain DAH-3) TaxID=1198029 RepID=A0A1U7LSE0_NEOID|nr:U6 snRNA phosphodiesterase [Neolecta irregularis DAH-3]|eukprot:OLL25585.1 U6 snRNA phosphodiesterase [Neolecta irregularis DAH-3]